jgi:hypothetical protein
MELWSINEAAAETGRDRRFLSKVLAHVPPDGRLSKKHPGWHLRTILDAVARQERGGAPDEALFDEGNRFADELQAFLDRLAAEPDVEERRKLFRRDGKVLSRCDEAWQRCIPQDAAAIYAPYITQVMGGALKAALELCEWRLG